MAAIEG